MIKNCLCIFLTCLLGLSTLLYPLGYRHGSKVAEDTAMIEWQDATAKGYFRGTVYGFHSGRAYGQNEAIFDLLRSIMPVAPDKIKDFQVYSNGDLIHTVPINDTGITYIFNLDCCGYICE